MPTSNRFIPSLEMLARAAQDLPDAESWRSDKYHVSLNDDRLLEFKRVRFKGKLGAINYKWVYNGKVRVT